MRLSANLIVNYANVNQFDFPKFNQWQIRAGDPNTLYFQLVDLDQSGLRYLAGIGSSNQPYAVMVTFPSIDDSKIISSLAIQVDANDSSLWKVALSPSQIPNTGNVVFSVSEGSSIRTFKVMAGLLVEFPGSDGSC